MLLIVFCTAASTSLSVSVSYITFLFPEWRVEIVFSLSESVGSYDKRSNPIGHSGNKMLCNLTLYKREVTARAQETINGTVAHGCSKNQRQPGDEPLNCTMKEGTILCFLPLSAG